MPCAGRSRRGSWPVAPAGVRRHRVGGRLGHLEASGLESLVPDGQAVAIEVEDLDPIPAAVEEEEEMAGQEVLAEAFLDQAREAVEALAHVGGPRAEEDPDGRGEHDHGVASWRGRPASAATTRPSHSGSGGASKRSRTWWGNSISTPRPGTGSVWWRTGIEVERNEQGRLGTCGKRPGREPSLPGVERGGGDTFTRAEVGDRQAAGGLSSEALPPGAFEIEVFGACHELAPGLEKGDQPSRIAAVARLDLPCAYLLIV